MASMMVIVSKAVFGKVKNDRGKKLGLGDCYLTEAYRSKNKSIAKKLTEDLYLVTVQDGALWLVGVLRNPSHDGEEWAAAQNSVPVTDISKLATKIEFSNGSGINVEKMAMSLQTPRVLADGDVELLTAMIPPQRDAPQELVSVVSIEDTVVKVLSRILGRTESSIRKDTKTYAAYHWDDGFIEMFEDEVDWEKGTFAAENDECWFWGRCDFDNERSFVRDDALYDVDDAPLAKRIDEGRLRFPQVAELIRDGRIELEFPEFIGKIESPTSLVSVAMHLFKVHQAFEPVETEFYEIDDKWTEMISEISDAKLREHLGAFFQSSDLARCFGACFQGGYAELIENNKDFETVASWWIGEGQGAFCIVRENLREMKPLPKPSNKKTKKKSAESSNTETKKKSTKSSETLPTRSAFVDSVIASSHTTETPLEQIAAARGLLACFELATEVNRRRILANVVRLTKRRQDIEALGPLQRAADLSLLYFPADAGMTIAVPFEFAFSTDALGNHEEGISYYTQLIECQPSQDLYWYNRACGHAILGRAKEALADLKEAVQRQPRWKERAKVSAYWKKVRADAKVRTFLAS